MTPMRVLDVSCTPDSRRIVIVLEDLQRQVRLVFSTDRHEAHRFAKELGRGSCPCNPVYDFIQSLLAACHATIARVVLEDEPGKGLGALIDLDLGSAGEAITLPCFPPDALALALRAKAPIYATARALAHAEPLSRGRVLPIARDVRRWLDRLHPGDFRF